MKYVRFDELENVLATLDMLAVLAPLVRRRRQQSVWKWVVIGAHDALQGALVCAVTDTSGTRILNKKSVRKCLTGWKTRRRNFLMSSWRISKR